MSWANDIRSGVMNTIDRNLELNQNSYNRLKDFESQVKRDIYKRLQSDFTEQFNGIKSAKTFIDNRSLWNPSRITNLVDSQARDMYMQHTNGWKYDSKNIRMVRP